MRTVTRSPSTSPRLFRPTYSTVGSPIGATRLRQPRRSRSSSRRQFAATLTLGRAPPRGATRVLAGLPPALHEQPTPGHHEVNQTQRDQEQRAQSVAQQGDPEQQLQHDADRKATSAAATTTTVPSATTEAGRAATGGGQCHWRHRQRKQQRD